MKKLLLLTGIAAVLAAIQVTSSAADRKEKFDSPTTTQCLCGRK